MRNNPTSFGAEPHAASQAPRSAASVLGMLVFLAILSVVTVVVGIAVLARISSEVERRITAQFVALEAGGNSSLSFLKALFGVELSGTADELARQIRNRNTNNIQQLLEAGLSPDSVDSTRNPAIRLAADAGFNEAVSLLLARGGNPDARGPDGSTALLSAIRRNNTALARVLIEKGAKATLSADDASTPLMAAAQKGNLTLCDLLVKGGSDVGAKNSEGLRALDYAVQSESLAVVDLLIRSGASPIDPDGKGESALLKAVKLKNSALVKALMVRGANFDTPTSSGRTVREQVFEQGMNILERPDGGIALVPAAPGQMRGGSTDPTAAEVAVALGTEEGLTDAAGESAETSEISAKSEAAPAATQKPAATPTPIVKKLTRLRVVGEIKGIWVSQSGTMSLAHVTADIRNVGDYTAENVRVRVTVPGGQEIKLTGPAKLEPYEQQEYVAKSPGAKVRQEGNLRAELSCDNCRGKE